MAKTGNAFRFGRGERNSFAPSAGYRGSPLGARILERLEWVTCRCGVANVVDTGPTAVGTVCSGCGKSVA